MSTSSAASPERFGCPSCRAVFRTGFARCPSDGEPLQALTTDPLEGSTFADRYVIEEMVGEGAMGRVYRARHQRVSRQFAIKVLFGDHATDPKMRERFAREAEAASRLSHPNVISVVDFGEFDSLLYLVMDFVEGRELEDVIWQDAPLATERVERLLRQLADGLEHAHREGLIHRDFKGTNVLLTTMNGKEVPRIVDFGLAVMSEMMEADRITTQGIVFGTPAYMSPEQATGQEIDHLTDLFALGVVLYEMLAGVGPFEGSAIAIARQNITSPPPPIAERVPGLEVDPVLELIALKLMAKKPAERYQSGAEVIAALDLARETEPARSLAAPGAATSDARAETAEEPATGRPIAGYVVAALIALIIVGGAGTMLWRTLSGGGEPRVAGVAIDAAVVSPVDALALATPDAVASEPVTDAAAASEPAPDAGKRVQGDRRPPRGDRRRPPDDRRDRDARPAPEHVDQATLLQLYNRVNRQITRLAAERGDAAARSFWSDYESIVVNDAIRNPALRAQYMRQLRVLQSRLRKAPP